MVYIKFLVLNLLSNLEVNLEAHHQHLTRITLEYMFEREKANVRVELRNVN